MFVEHIEGSCREEFDGFSEIHEVCVPAVACRRLVVLLHASIIILLITRTHNQ
jgi:hypothetical protein